MKKKDLRPKRPHYLRCFDQYSTVGFLIKWNTQKKITGEEIKEYTLMNFKQVFQKV
jgi:hypothetical protein